MGETSVGNYGYVLLELQTRNDEVCKTCLNLYYGIAQYFIMLIIPTNHILRKEHCTQTADSTKTFLN